MKLWRLNSILLIFIISFSYINSISETLENRNISDQSSEFENNLKNSLSNENISNSQNEESKLEKEYLNLMEMSSEIEQGNKKNKSPKNFNRFFNNKKNKNIKKLPKKIEIPAPKYKIEFNPHIPKDPKALIKDERHVKCVQKSGYIYLSRNVFPTINKPNLIKVVPIFTILTKRSISLMMGPEEKSLFNTINLDNILKITQRYTNSYCFDIIENNIVEKSLAKGPVTLCANTSKIMKNWINAIQEFKECSINVFDANTQNKVLIDFEKVNKLLKDKDKNNIAKETKPLYYQKQSPYIKNPKRIENEKKISQTLNQIVTTIETGTIAQNQMRRRMSSKIKNAEKFAFDIRKKQDMINQMMQKRLIQEKDKESKLISIEHRARELQLLKAVQQRIRQYKLQEMKQYKTIISTRLSEIKERANEDAKKMMRTLIDQQKLSPYEECYDDRLFLFKNKKYVHGVCFKLFGENRGESCEDKKEFCNMCCEFHIGMRYSNKVYDCKQKCTKVITGLITEENNQSKSEKNKSEKNKSG